MSEQLPRHWQYIYSNLPRWTRPALTSFRHTIVLLERLLLERKRHLLSRWTWVSHPVDHIACCLNISRLLVKRRTSSTHQARQLQGCLWEQAPQHTCTTFRFDWWIWWNLHSIKRLNSVFMFNQTPIVVQPDPRIWWGLIKLILVFFGMFLDNDIEINTWIYYSNPDPNNLY
jgi:hypothetical protein